MASQTSSSLLRGFVNSFTGVLFKYRGTPRQKQFSL